jgi:site-specific recombinase XerD
VRSLVAAVGGLGRPPQEAQVIRLLIELSYMLGLRISEVSALNWGHVDQERGELLIQNSKYATSRAIPFGDSTRGLFAELLQLRVTTTPPGASDPVFQGRRGRYTPRGIQHVFRALRRLSGLPDSVTFHSLRHGAATRLIQKGCRLTVVRDFLGHKDLSTTNRYLHVIETESLRSFL